MPAESACRKQNKSTYSFSGRLLPVLCSSHQWNTFCNATWPTLFSLNFCSYQSKETMNEKMWPHKSTQTLCSDTDSPAGPHLKANHSRQKFLASIKQSSSIDFNRAASASIEQWGAWLYVPQLQSISSMLWHQAYSTGKDNSLTYKPLLRLKTSFLFPAPVKFPVPQKIPHVYLHHHIYRDNIYTRTMLFVQH